MADASDFSPALVLVRRRLLLLLGVRCTWFRFLAVVFVRCDRFLWCNVGRIPRACVVIRHLQMRRGRVSVRCVGMRIGVQ
jgi:hypothetical protein